MENTSEKLSLGTKLGFGIGDLYGGGSMVIIGFYYLYFLTDVLLITPALAGVAFLVSKMWDAVSDPLMGVLSDRTRTRFGRRRPYLMIGIPLIFFSFFLLWYPVDFSREIHRFIYVLCAYIFFSTILTLVMVPYNALSSEMTLDYNERTSLTTFRIFFSSFSSLLCAVVPLEIVKLFPDVRLGYIVMALSFGLFFALPFFAVFFSTREREEFQKEAEPFTFYQTFFKPFRIPTFLNVLFMYLFAFVALDVVMAIVIYFMTYYLGRGGETNYVLGTLLLFQIFALPLYSYISHKTDKRTSYICASGFLLLMMCFSIFIKPEMHAAIIYIFGALVGIGSGGVVIMIYAIFPDMPDIDELYTGERREGLYSGLFTFMRKASSAIAIATISTCISLAGYVPPVEKTVDGATQMIKQAQTPEFFLVLRIVFAVLPVLLLVFCLINAFRYQLSGTVHQKLKTVLEKKRSVSTLSTDAKTERGIKDLLERRV